MSEVLRFLRDGALMQDAAERIRHVWWDHNARRADERIVRCGRCGGWSWDYPRCRHCRTRHQRRAR